VIHKFQKSLKVGKAGEATLLKLWPELVAIAGGRKGDFLLGDQKVELKTDSYDMDASPNFFMERYSGSIVNKEGGPWQSLEHGSHLFVYFFSKNLTAFVFNTEKLVEALNVLIPDLKPVTVRNIGWNTVGYKVPREALAHLYEVKSWKL
jgi:hypothetical protein